MFTNFHVSLSRIAKYNPYRIIFIRIYTHYQSIMHFNICIFTVIKYSTFACLDINYYRYQYIDCQNKAKIYLPIISDVSSSMISSVLFASLFSLSSKKFGNCSNNFFFLRSSKLSTNYFNYA